MPFKTRIATALGLYEFTGQITDARNPHLPPKKVQKSLKTLLTLCRWVESENAIPIERHRPHPIAVAQKIAILLLYNIFTWFT